MNIEIRKQEKGDKRMDHLTRKCINVKEAETRAKDPEFRNFGTMF